MQKIAVCCPISVKHDWESFPPGPNSWKAWKGLGGSHVRLGVPINVIAKPPAKLKDSTIIDLTLFDAAVNSIIVNELGIHLDAGCAPAWASEGKDTYVGLIPGSAWWNNGTGPDEGIHFFDQNPATNPKYAAIDQKQPARPGLTAEGMPHINPLVMYDAGRTLAGTTLGGVPQPIQSIGVWNEPGGDLFYPPIRFDGQPGFSDVIKDWFFPDIVIPFTKGVRASRPNAIIVGCEADSADTLDRFLKLDAELFKQRPQFSVCDRISTHNYGDLKGGPSYATTGAFKKVINSYAPREWEVGEITGDPQELYDWFEQFVANNPDCYGVTFNDPKVFFEPGTWEIPFDATVDQRLKWKPIPSIVGLKFSTIFKQITGVRHI